MKRIIFILAALFWFSGTLQAQEPHVAVVQMKMMILPGTQGFLEKSIARATAENAKLLVITFDTPGGVLQTTQEMIQAIFQSPVPIVVYVSPTGATATSAGVFITLAAHVAAMAPGTSMGAAHPVMGDGKDIEGDMKTKAENMTIALVKSIAEQRARNVAWAEKAVKESNSITEQEAQKLGVVDLVAPSLESLLQNLKGREVKLASGVVKLDDYSTLPRINYEMSFADATLNFLANPNVAALLWLIATTGISIELYNPGAILPGVVGVIALVLALVVSQVLPVSQGAIALLIIGAMLIGLELLVPSGILGIGGIIAMVIGALYLVDVGEAPGLSVSLPFVSAAALFSGGLLLVIASAAVRTLRKKAVTGREGMAGLRGKAMESFSTRGKIFVNGETWEATLAEGLVQEGDEVEVLGIQGLIARIRKV